MPNSNKANSQNRPKVSPTIPPTGAQFHPLIPDKSLVVVPNCVHVVRGWLPKKLSDVIGVRIVEETYEMSIPQYGMGKKGTPVRNEEHRLIRVGDGDLGQIVYKGKEQPVLEWTPALRELKNVLQEEIGVPFNSASVRYLVNGNIASDPHSDVALMPSLGEQPTIAHVGFGETRRYEFRAAASPADVKFHCDLNPGDLMIFHGRSQVDWLYGVPPDQRVKSSRVQLSFRFFLPTVDRTGVSGAQRISSSIRSTAK